MYMYNVYNIYYFRCANKRNFALKINFITLLLHSFNIIIDDTKPDIRKYRILKYLIEFMHR